MPNPSRSSWHRPWSVAAAATVLAAATLASVTVQAAPAAEPQRYIVAFEPGQAAQGRAALREAGGEVVRNLPGRAAVAAMVRPGRVAALSGARGVRFVEVDQVREPFSQETPYGVTMTQADQLSPATPESRTVCVIDSGYHVGHEDLPANVTGDDDPGGTGAWNEDGDGHGTHVAGTIAAVDNDLGVVGVNPGVNLHIVRVFGDDGIWAYSSDLVAALDKCLAAEAHVINMSLGGSRQSRLEKVAFAAAYDAGVLSVAAAGNDGNKRTSFPAGYDSVISVAAVDENMAKADFSQSNRTVELAAPGVGVLSTVPYVETATLTVGGQTFSGHSMEFAAEASATGDVVDGGLCTSSDAWDGLVVLCQRGQITFGDKVANVVAGGGVAAVIYNNAPGNFIGTLGSAQPIPAISLSDTDGAAALAFVGQAGTVVNEIEKPASGYAAWDGTSMATPHVAGIAALIWACAPDASNAQIRKALADSALDLGKRGRDHDYGHGLVQAVGALNELGKVATTTC
ncbi:S8 family serine peptidase [Nocardioides limicola]|uniref:S8 family serine peptidase n=1 Tax=Nocardioides limicola TaxID=2803368 RepID=UPI00193B8F58|nr:S8 family serine peptidase [Nocardioides sp. DJM-14]